MANVDSHPLYRILQEAAASDRTISREDALQILENGALDIERLVAVAEIPRRRHFHNLVQIHILNNIRNGHCPEDCSYCAQRKTGTLETAYTSKSEQEILAEAKRAYESGAHRYCLVTAGTGPSRQSAAKLADTIRAIKSHYPIKLCLSAGIVTDPEIARMFAEAGLDRYNHNLNTSEAYYDSICTTHTFADRKNTLAAMHDAGISLCSGVIAGMGETDRDIVDAGLVLAQNQVPSIPVNFFLPVPGHAVKAPTPMTPEKALRMLIMFRLTNPRAEIRMAAGREIHLGQLQGTALRVANSLFVNGYLNVRGSNAAETMELIRSNGFEIDAANSDFSIPTDISPRTGSTNELQMKTRDELRPVL